MSIANPYFIIILLTVVLFYKLDFFANLLNLKALKPGIPKEFEGIYDGGKYAQSQDYTRESTRFELIESTVSLMLFMFFWFVGGFGWLDDLVRSWSSNSIIAGLAFVSVLFLATTILNIPFQLYDTFVIEEKFGFNKMTLTTYVIDLVKGLLLGAVLGLPVLALIFYLFESFELAWLWAWIAVSGISLLLTYLAPTLIMPLFNKFSPLEDGELKDSIHRMATKCEFPLKEVSIMDGSKRSSKSNAFFTGIGKNKKIALYDTLIEKQSVPELVAILAHEIGHFKKKHIVQQMVISIAQMGMIFFLLNIFMNNEKLFAAFGVSNTSVYLSFIFFFMLFKPISKVLSILMAILSRKNEYEADAYASEVTGGANHLIEALKKLSKDNLSNLTPHPFYVWMYYSHPPMLERIEALRKTG